MSTEIKSLVCVYISHTHPLTLVHSGFSELCFILDSFPLTPFRLVEIAPLHRNALFRWKGFVFRALKLL